MAQSDVSVEEARTEVHLYTYQWNTKIDWEHIDCFALTKTGDIMYVKIENFTPYLYMELPPHCNGRKIKWDKRTRSYLIEYIREKFDDSVCDVAYEKKRKLYFTGLEYDIEEKKYKHKKHDFLFISFKTKEKLITFKNSMRFDKNIDGIGRVKLPIYEEFIDPILQFHSRRQIMPTSWVTLTKFYIPNEEERLSKCDEEYWCNWKDVIKCTNPQYQNLVPRPRIAAVDFEAYSSNWNAMPSSKNPKDVLFQAGIVYCTQGEKEPQWKKRIISMGKLDHDTVKSKDSSIDIDDGYQTEKDFIFAYFKFINEYNPAVIVSYNGFGWDFLYLAERCLLNDCMSALDHSLLLNEKYDSYTKKWSSSAMRNQNYYIPKISGRFYVDLLPIVRASPVFRLDSYSLNAVATFLLGVTKDDVSAKQIFKYHEKGDPISLGIIGKYCVQDSNVTLKIFDKMKTWFDLTETSCVINLPMIECFTVGQQQKTMAQLYKECIKSENNIVITRNEFHDENDRYRGANVAYPITGIHEYAVSEDFAALYPSIIISNNLDFSTFVPDCYLFGVPEEHMTKYEWHDSYGCPHDTDFHDSKIPATKMLCKDRKFHFLKEPKGILPGILENLLKARKMVKNQMEEAEKKIKETKDPDEQFELEQLALILDKRQNALKISANSVKSDTPIPCKIKGKLDYKNIEDLSQGDWKAINDDQEISTPIKHLKVWSDIGFTKVKHIMRHPNKQQQLLRTNTHTGIVDTTKDHSLLRPDGKEVKPTELSIGEDLMHSCVELPSDTPLKPKYCVINKEIILEYHKTLNNIEDHEAFVLGFFMAEGTCGSYRDNKHSWSIVNKDPDYIQKCLESIQKANNEYQFYISSYANDPDLLHLRPKKKEKKIKYLVEDYRNKFYDKRGHKKVPEKILNSHYSVRLSFMIGYYMGDGNRNLKAGIKITNRGQIGSSGLYYITRSLGYKVSLWNPKDDIYTLQCTTYFRNQKEIAIKRIIPSTDLIPMKKLIKDVVVNDQKIEFDGKRSNYKGIVIECQRTPRLKLITLLDNLIELCNSYGAVIETYHNKKITFYKTCCSSRKTITTQRIRSSKICLECNCDKVHVGQKYENYEEEKEVEYVYDLETESHHFAAGIGDLIVHNSGYGITGVKKGRIPCMPVAQTTTFIGRQSFQKIYKLVESSEWNAKRIYGDTDSCYLIFNQIRDPMICEEKAIQFSKEATKLFPPPMKLEYEKKIYRVFLLISKKKYVYIVCDKNGKIEMDKDKSGNYTDKYKIYKKGVLLTRRDNTKFMKEVYQTLIQDIIDSTLKNIPSNQLYDNIIDYLIGALNRLYSKSLNISQLTITKSIKENIDYKIRALPDDPEKRKKRLEKLECMDESEYIMKALPAIVQLAEKMRRRGQFVPAGSRIEYLFLDVGDMKANQWKKVESLQYYKEHSSSLQLDFIHYNKLLINPIDQLLNIVKAGSKFMEEHFKDRILKYQMIEEMKRLFRCKVSYVDTPS